MAYSRASANAGHTSPSVYAALDVTSKSEALQKLTDDAVQLAVWTTTPWTLPANLAVAVNGDLTYAVVDSGSRKLIVAEDLVDELAAKFDTPLNVIGLLRARRSLGLLIADQYPTTLSQATRPSFWVATTSRRKEVQD